MELLERPPISTGQALHRADERDADAHRIQRHGSRQMKLQASATPVSSAKASGSGKTTPPRIHSRPSQASPELCFIHGSLQPRHGTSSPLDPFEPGKVEPSTTRFAAPV